MDYLSIYLDRINRQRDCFPEIKAIHELTGGGMATFNGPGYMLLGGKGEQLIIDGRNWGVKVAAALLLGCADTLTLSLPDKLKSSDSLPLPDPVFVEYSSINIPESIPEARILQGSILQPEPILVPLNATAGLLSAQKLFLSILNNLHNEPQPWAFSADICSWQMVVLLSRESARLIDPRREMITRIHAAMLANPRAEYDPYYLADAHGMSFSSFRRHWKRVMNKSLHQVLSEIRMEKARTLLCETTMKINQIAQATGFDDQLYFSRRFVQFYGKSPRAYRQLFSASQKTSRLNPESS